jgi:DNA-binding transcriptional LysR family regulator
MDDEGDAAVQRPIEPNWEDLRIALAVARAQSLARAADILGVDPGTVSRRIGAAEAALGTILFVRSKTGVTLTDAGRALLTRAAEMEARARRLVEEVAEPGPIAGT